MMAYFFPKNIFSLLLLVCCLSILATGLFALPHKAQSSTNSPSIIRDTEIEAILKEWGDPIFKAANIPSENVNIILVQSPDVNAFVAGGSNIFFYTGLMDKTENPGELIGVFAHELGHIAGSHLISTRQAMERASYESILGAVLGIGAAILGGGDAAGTIVGGSQSMAQRRFLAHSRINESAADQAALRFFENAHFNPTGMQTFLEKLQSEELMPASQQSEYVRTHPLTINRIEAVKNKVGQSAYKDSNFPDHWYEQHARMKAKLIGFISPGQVAWDYDDRDQSIPARYARSIAAYQHNEIQKAIQLIDGLIAEEPDNPYFYELKGQMLVDFARIDEAIPNYQKSVELMPDAPLLRVALAHALMQDASDRDRLEEAVNHLQRALNKEPRSSRAHRLLATAYGQMGQENLAKLHLAEEAVLQRRLDYAAMQAKSVLDQTQEGGREWVQAKDLLDYIKTLKARNK